MNDWSFSLGFLTFLSRFGPSVTRPRAMVVVRWWGWWGGRWAAGWRRRAWRAVAAFSFGFLLAGAFLLGGRCPTPSVFKSLFERFQPRRLHNEPAAVELLSIHLFHGFFRIIVVLILLWSWWRYDESVDSLHLDAHDLAEGSKEVLQLVFGGKDWEAFDVDLGVSIPLGHLN